MAIAFTTLSSFVLMGEFSEGAETDPGAGDKVATVAVVRAALGTVAQEVTFDAELRPYQEVSLHAKVTGYLETITVEAGDTVAAGQLLATIEVPELRDDIQRAEASLRRSQADVDRAQASFEEARLANQRVEAAGKAQPQLIARQDLDTAKALARTAEASLASTKQQVQVAEADLKKLKTMLAFTRITAPFAGVVTKRMADPGTLIQAGTSSGSMPLVRLSENDRLRVSFPVSISFVSRIKPGDPADVRIASLGRTFPGKVARVSRKVETATRTMEAEVDLPNADLLLTPGIYATVLLKLDRRENVLVLPMEAVTRDKKSATVMVIATGNRIEERAVTLGVEMPAKLEIVNGLKDGDLVVFGSRSQLKPGQKVEPKLIELPKSE
jgi:RND family efflux transporter MFP subunit